VTVSIVDGTGTAITASLPDGSARVLTVDAQGNAALTGITLPPGASVTLSVSQPNAPPWVAQQGSTLTSCSSGPTSFTLGIDAPEVMAEQAAALANCSVIKLKLGGDDGGDVARVRILRNGGLLLDFALVSATLSDCPGGTGVFTYRVEASAADGRVAFQQASVTVGATAQGIGGVWRLTNINGANIVPGTEVTAIFGDGGNLSGSSGCSTYSAAHQLNGSSLAIGSLTNSGQFCAQPVGVMEQEQLFLTVLAAASGYSVDGNQLTIRSGRGQLTFIRAG